MKRGKPEGQARDSWQDTELGSCLDNNTPCRVGAPAAPSYRGLEQLAQMPGWGLPWRFRG